MRSRNIKPGFFKNDVLAECSPLARLLFAGLWCMADREGRIEYRPKKIKAEVLPYDNCNIENLIEELTVRSFVTIYSVSDGTFLDIPTFLKHQHPHLRELPSTIPVPPETGESPVPDQGQAVPRQGSAPDRSLPGQGTARCQTRSHAVITPADLNEGATTLLITPQCDQDACEEQKQVDDENHTRECDPECEIEAQVLPQHANEKGRVVPRHGLARCQAVPRQGSARLIPDSLLLIPDSLTLIPDSPAREVPANSPSKGKPARAPGRVSSNGLFDTFWRSYPKKQSKGQAEKAFRKINPDEQLLATMIATIERAKTSEDWCKEGGRFIPHPATWLNNRRWEDEDVETHPLSGKVSDLTLRNLKVLQNWRPDNGK